MMYNEPWSKRHKKITGGLPYNLSNSFAEPLNTAELVKLSLARGDIKIVDAYYNHSLVYTPNGGSLDIREEIAKLYGANINAENIVVFSGGQVALQTAAIALLGRDDHSIVFSPGYQSVQEAPLQAGSEYFSALKIAGRLIQKMLRQQLEKIRNIWLLMNHITPREH